MKNMCVVLVVLLLAAVPAMAGIKNSAHDLSGQGTFVSPSDGTTAYGAVETDQLCVFCHTPHGALTTAPLWNRSATDMTGSVPYSSSTFDSGMTTTNGDIPLCMGCHDGVMTESLINLNGVATAALNPDLASSETLTIPVAAVARIGLDFTNDHPVGFTYAAATDLQGGLQPIGTGTGSAPFVPDDLLRGTNEMWCASCHNVHEPGTGGTAPFLRVTTTSSELCFVCHNK